MSMFFSFAVILFLKYTEERIVKQADTNDVSSYIIVLRCKPVIFPYAYT